MSNPKKIFLAIACVLLGGLIQIIRDPVLRYEILNGSDALEQKLNGDITFQLQLPQRESSFFIPDPADALPVLSFPMKESLVSEKGKTWFPDVALSKPLPPNKVLRWMIGSGDMAMTAGPGGLAPLFPGYQEACVEITDNASYTRSWEGPSIARNDLQIVMLIPGIKPELDHWSRRNEAEGRAGGRPTLCTVFAVVKS